MESLLREYFEQTAEYLRDLIERECEEPIVIKVVDQPYIEDFIEIAREKGITVPMKIMRDYADFKGFTLGDNSLRGFREKTDIMSKSFENLASEAREKSLNCIILLVGLRGKGYGSAFRMEWVRETTELREKVE